MKSQEFDIARGVILDETNYKSRPVVGSQNEIITSDISKSVENFLNPESVKHDSSKSAFQLKLVSLKIL